MFGKTEPPGQGCYLFSVFVIKCCCCCCFFFVVVVFFFFFFLAFQSSTVFNAAEILIIASINATRNAINDAFGEKIEVVIMYGYKDGHYFSACVRNLGTFWSN